MGNSPKGNRPRLVITNWRDLRHPEAGGAEVVCHELAARFVRSGYDVIMLSASVSGTPRSEVVPEGYAILRRGNKFSVYAWALWWLLIHRRGIDVVIDSQNGIPFYAPLVVPRRVPTIMILHHVHQNQFGKYFSPLMAAVGRWLEKVPSRRIYGSRSIVAVSPSTRKDARSILRLRGNIVVAPPGWTKTGSWSGDRAERTTVPTVVCVGRLVPHKRVDLLIQTIPALAERFPGIHVHVIGSGPEDKKLRATALDLGAAGSVTFHGSCTDAERDSLVSRAWLSVSASQGEGWGISVLEANAHGVPALAYRRPGLRDSIRDQVTGWLLSDEQDLAQGIGDVLETLRDPAVAEEFSASARRWAELFTWDSMARKVEQVVQEEQERLGLEFGDRRPTNDLATVIEIPLGSLPGGWAPTFRDSDRTFIENGILTVLLMGADTVAAGIALGRVGLGDLREGLRPMIIRVARTMDYLHAGSAGLRPADGQLEPNFAELADVGGLARMADDDVIDLDAHMRRVV